MYLFTALQHGDEFAQAPLSRLLLLRLVEAVEDRVAVGAIEGSEELGRRVISVELALEVSWNLRGPLSLVCGLPAAVRFRRLDLGEAGRPHPARRDQRFRLLAVDPRPASARAPRREALQEVRLVEAALLAVDPAEAKGHLERLSVGDAALRRPFLRDLQPDALGLVVLLQPALQLGRAGEETNRKLVGRARHAELQPGRVGQEVDLGGVAAAGEEEELLAPGTLEGLDVLLDG